MVERLSGSKVSFDITTVEKLSESNLKIITVYAFKELLKTIAEYDDSGIYTKLYM